MKHTYVLPCFDVHNSQKTAFLSILADWRWEESQDSPHNQLTGWKEHEEMAPVKSISSIEKEIKAPPPPRLRFPFIHRWLRSYYRLPLTISYFQCRGFQENGGWGKVLNVTGVWWYNPLSPRVRKTEAGGSPSSRSTWSM